MFNILAMRQDGNILQNDFIQNRLVYYANGKEQRGLRIALIRNGHCLISAPFVKDLGTPSQKYWW